MDLRGKLLRELKTVALTTFFFALWFGVLVTLKRLVLEDQQIRFRGASAALLGALVAAKVVLVLEHVPLGSWLRGKAALLDVVLRTALYALGVFVVLLSEKAFEARHEFGGFGAAVRGLLERRDMPQLYATTLGVSCALAAFNALSILRRHLGGKSLAQVFLAPPPEVTRAGE